MQSNHNYSFFTLRNGEGLVIIMLYGDDLLIIGNDETLIDEAKHVLH